MTFTRKEIRVGLHRHALQTQDPELKALLEAASALLTGGASNNAMRRTLEYDVADAPMLREVLSLGVATAMMCGHRGAKVRLAEYEAVLKDEVPDIARLYDGEVWAEIGMALTTAKGFKVTLAKEGWRSNHWSREGKLTVIVDGKAFDAKSFDRYRFGDPILEEVFQAITYLAPLDCDGVLATEFDKEET